MVVSKSSQKGFTLVELMIVIAIIAILAAVAMNQYSAYKNKAKAKELVGFARACVMEARTQCEANPDTTDFTTLQSCQGPWNDTKYLTGISVTATPACNASYDVEATATLDDGTTSCNVNCYYNYTSDDISCSAPTCQ